MVMIGSRWLDNGAGYRKPPTRRAAALMLLVAAVAPFAGPTSPAASSGPASVPTPVWAVRPPVHVARVGLDVATVDGNIFAIGGFDPGRSGVFNSVESRQTDGSGAWSAVAPMPTARANVAVAALGGAVYAVGGFTDELTLDTVEKFDPASGAWSSETRLPAPRGAAGAAALGDPLYVAGGLVTPRSGPGDEEGNAPLFLFYPTKQKRDPGAPVPTPPGGRGAGA